MMQAGDDARPPWLTIVRGEAPLVVSIPHAGTLIPAEIEARCVSPWLARKDADWYLDSLYGFAREIDATLIQTAMSRTVVDVNRPLAGASPGAATTDLVPMTTFDGEPLWRKGEAPTPDEIAERTAAYHQPYHDALASQLARLRARHPVVVLYDCHAIRSVVPRLFPGELPVMNIGTNGGAACDLELAEPVTAIACATRFSTAIDGRFKGGHITRTYGKPDSGVHALQMELAFRGFLREPVGLVTQACWPPPYDARFAAPLQDALRNILACCLAFAREAAARPA